jgi:hypothetical protein
MTATVALLSVSLPFDGGYPDALARYVLYPCTVDEIVILSDHENLNGTRVRGVESERWRHFFVKSTSIKWKFLI